MQLKLAQVQNLQALQQLSLDMTSLHTVLEEEKKINIFGMITFPGSIYQLSKAGQTHYK